MKDIVFIFPAGCFPVPAIDGGAVEALITNLINENEINQEFNFHVIMCKHKDDDRDFNYTKYKNTKFYDYYQSDLKFIIGKYVNALNKRSNYLLPIYSSYEKFIIKTINGINPDFVIYEGSFNAAIRKLLKIVGKNKLCLHVHHQIILKYNLEKFFGNMICVSEFIKNDWVQSKKLSSDFNYIVLNNVLTSNNFTEKISESQKQEIRNKYNIKEGDFVVIYCGRLIKEKGVDTLIKAVNHINNEKLKLLIIGGSSFKNSKQTKFVKYLQEIANKNTIFTGFIDNDKLNQYYSIANLHVIPSVCEEAAPVTALESLAQDVPQLITNSGGLPEYVGAGAVMVEKHVNLQESLEKEILNFIEGKYHKNVCNSQRIAGSREYFGNFIDIINKNV